MEEVKIVCPDCETVNLTHPALNDTKCHKCGFDLLFVLSRAEGGSVRTNENGALVWAPSRMHGGGMDVAGNWAARQHVREYGPVNTALICPHCGARGAVNTRDVKLKTGISGGKATAALLTGGLSVLGTGLSRKQKATEAHCNSCGSTWHF